MQTQPPTSIGELWRKRIRQRTRAWNTLTIPIIVLGIFAILWLLAELFGGAIAAHNPFALLISAIALSTVVIVGRWGFHYLEISRSQKDPLFQKVTQATSHIAEEAATGKTREGIVGVLYAEIMDIFAPRPLETALYDALAHDYHISTTGQTIAAGNPLVEWLLKQPIAVPIPLPVSTMPTTALREAQETLLERGLIMIIPLGNSGWIGLGTPTNVLAYTDTERTFLNHLARPAAEGMERVSTLEKQQKRAQELRSLYWIAQAVNFAMELDDLMELIYTQLKRVMNLPIFYIALKDPDQDILSYAFYVEKDDRLYLDDVWDLDEDLTGIVIRNSMTIRTDQYVQECKNREITPRDENPPFAWMAAPLTAGDKSVGVMVAASHDPHLIFSEEDENFFVTVAAYMASIMERHHLYDRLESRARQLGTLNEIGNLLASSLDLNRVLELVVRNAAKLLDAEAGSLLLLDEDSHELVFRISSGPAGAKLVGMRMPSDKGIAGAAFTENRPIITQNTQNDQRWYGNIDKKAEFVTQAVIAVPLNARGRSIGVLEAINRRDNRSFNNEDAELLMAFAAQSAIAIENARMFTMTDQALQARLEELTTLQLIDRQLNTTLNYNEVMTQTLEWAINMTETKVGLVAALQEEEDGVRGLRFLAHRGYDETIFKRYSEEELWPLRKGLIGHTVETGETSLVRNVGDNPYYSATIPGMQAQLSVPIKREDRVIGVIALESGQIDCFNEEDIALIERLADHAAIAIENARLFEQVQRANEAKTEFVSFVSHELKQPMTSMKGYTDLLMKGIGGELNEQQMQFLQVIRSNVGRMDQLVQSLLDISRIESGRLKLEMGEVVPEEMISEAVQAFEPTINAKNQQILVNIEPNLPSIIGDRGRLLQVLTNLISNANKYTPEGGRISLRADRWMDNNTAYVRWSVQDTGIGMTPEELERLFTKYFRSSNAAVRSVQGTGLGLVITRSIIEMHGGQIWVESEYQKGSTFSFAIPTAQ
ncbi:MAG: GAF domain-containing protein [Anaerolineae bacterium]|nr:GAF domain-containing protein [Anaerolineae bacterium]